MARHDDKKTKYFQYVKYFGAMQYFLLQCTKGDVI